MKRLIFYILLACFLSSCVRLWKIDPQELIDKSSFGQMVGGKVDREHDWNLATSAQVSVITGKDGKLEIYGLQGGESCLLGRYNAEKGLNTFTFDIEDGASKVYVASYGDRKVLECEIGSSVDFTKSATSKAVFEQEGGAFGVSTIDKYQEYLNVGSFIANAHNTTKHGLYSTKDGYFILHPIHFQQNDVTKGMFTYGIYYLQNGELVHQPIYTPDDQSFTQIRHSDPNGSWVGEWTDADIKGTWSGNDRRSKGIRVNVPQGANFGFYVKMFDWGGEFTVYSEASRNEDSIIDQWNNKRVVAKTEFCSFWTDGINDYLSFRQDHNPYNDNYNGMVFACEGLLKDNGNACEEVDIPRKASSWILACEDLGNMADCDFNDIVYRISHVAGEENATVTPLAAGGTIPARLRFRGNIFGPEIHDAFRIKTNEMANTFRNKQHIEAESFTVPVGPDFSMSGVNMGGFDIIVGEGIVSVIAGSEHALIPYMICIPGNYKWCLERIAIADAYHDFAAWCADHTDKTDWYCRPIEGNTY